MRTYGYRRSLAEANEAANRRPENRLIYAQQQVDWFYTDLLKAQRWFHLSHGVRGASAMRKAARDLAEAHERLTALEVE